MDIKQEYYIFMVKTIENQIKKLSIAKLNTKNTNLKIFLDNEIKKLNQVWISNLRVYEKMIASENSCI